MGGLTAKSPRLQRLRRLSSDRRARREAGVFVVEGPHLVADAAAAGVLEEVYVEVGRAADVPPGVPVREVAPGVLRRVTDATTSQGIAGVARLVAAGAPDDVAPGAPILVLAAVADPGNVGTLLRSAEAAGFGAVLCTAGSVDPWSPKCVRASAGSIFRIAVGDGGEGVTVLRQVAGAGRRRVGTTAGDAAMPYDEADLPVDVALVLGNEAHGLPGPLADEIDQWVTIPMARGPESLNVAMAGTVLCFELARRRRAGPASDHRGTTGG